MKPKHLPDLWSVNHQEERLGVKAAENRIDMEQDILATQVNFLKRSFTFLIH